MLAYKPNATETLTRLREFYERRALDSIRAAFTVPSPTLTTFAATHTEGVCDYPDPRDRLGFWDGYLRERSALEDDSIPSALLSEFDQGLYGAVLGAEIGFNCNPATGWISSMAFPLLKDWTEFDRLTLDEGHPWFRRFEEQLDVFAAGAQGKFGIAHLILINGLNFVFELVGATQTYLDLLEQPAAVRRAIELGTRVNRAVQRRYFERVPLLAGGTCSNGAQWIPGRIIAESVDPFHMTSVAYFEEWGRAVTEEIFAGYDGGITHLHANGRHLLEAVGTLCGLKALILGDDHGYAPTIEILADLRQRAGNLPLIAGVEFPDFVQRLKDRTLPGNVLYLVRNTPDAAGANRCMESVRAYRV